MNTDVHAPIYTLPTGRFALPLAEHRLKHLASTAYLQQFLPPQPVDDHARMDDAILCACALELWSAIVESAASRPALEVLAARVIEAAGGPPEGDERKTGVWARLLVESSMDMLSTARTALEISAQNFAHHISVIPAEAARSAGASLSCRYGAVGKEICDQIYIVEGIRQRSKFSAEWPLPSGELWHNWLSFDHPHVPAPLVAKIFRAVWSNQGEDQEDFLSW